MPKHRWLVALGACVCVLWMGNSPVRSQAVLPLRRDFDQAQMEQQGLMLIEDAIQLSRFQQYEWAIPRAKLATQLVPERFEAWYILGTLLVQERELDAGIQALTTAKRLNPRESGVHSILGSAYFQQGDYEGALRSLKTATQLGDNSIETLFDLGNTQYKLKQYDAAIATYNQAVALDATFWPGINNIGLIQYEQGKVDAAIDSWQKAIALDPTAAEPQLAVAVATYTKGDRAKGLELTRTALDLDGRYGEIDFLVENLWGEKLIQATQAVFDTPTVQAFFTELDRRAFQPEMEP
ncbi:tetratricopeptide repeat protein [Synechococcus sp. BDU 130192]|uniref:tetratricopeptide repeat protein n=1 Tax=Synechococcus sp. BDU 130192 TaxID=2042059 RepID=UPI000C073DDC|nr:tetratricopeptide repeat protein [Synechococcus sp. BDU 130192]